MIRNCGSTYKKESCVRKNNKQMMEKKRRARINTCLTEIKNLVLKDMKKEESDFAKLEKADILELTVAYLKSTRNGNTRAAPQNEESLAKYRAGFNECARKAFKYISSSPYINDDNRLKLMEHLAEFLYTKDTSRVLQTKNDNFVRVLPKVKTVKQEMPSPPLGFTKTSDFFTTSPVSRLTCPDNGRLTPTSPSTLSSVFTYPEIYSSNWSTVDGTNNQNPQFIPIDNQVQGTECDYRHENTNCNKTSSEKMWRPW